MAWRPRLLRAMSRPLDSGAYRNFRPRSRGDEAPIMPTSDFSGLVSSTCALARAAAIAPIDSLNRCMAALHVQDIDRHRPRFRPFCPDAVPGCLLGVFRHQSFELGLSVFVLEVGLSRAPKDAGEFGPRVRRAHVHDPHGFDPGPWWFGAEKPRGFATLDAAPEVPFRRQKEVLVERIGWSPDLDPFVGAADYRKHR